MSSRSVRWPSVPAPVRGRIAVVGICASGKTTLVAELAQRGFDARQCGQEHSYVPDMWRRVSRPQVLVYLDASPEIVRRRRAFEYPPQRYQRQTERLRHAREHCHIYVNTDPLTPSQVLEAVLQALERYQIQGTTPEKPSQSIPTDLT